jgi:hypothetical protein
VTKETDNGFLLSIILTIRVFCSIPSPVRRLEETNWLRIAHPRSYPVRGVDSFVATGDPLLTSISNLRKEKKERKSTVHVQGVPYIAQGLTLENN